MFVMSTVIITGSTTLRELDVSHNNNGDKWISVIIEGLQSNKTIAKLNVSWCDLSVKGTVYTRCVDVFKLMVDDWYDISISH